MTNRSSEDPLCLAVRSSEGSERLAVPHDGFFGGRRGWRRTRPGAATDYYDFKPHNLTQRGNQAHRRYTAAFNRKAVICGRTVSIRVLWDPIKEGRHSGHLRQPLPLEIPKVNWT